MTMDRENVERIMEEAGWKLDAGFRDRLVIGHDSVVSLLAYPRVWEDDDPTFEISHEEKDITYWVREIPTPQQAIKLIEENGGPPEEERGKPRNAAMTDEQERQS